MTKPSRLLIIMYAYACIKINRKQVQIIFLNTITHNGEKKEVLLSYMKIILELAPEVDTGGRLRYNPPPLVLV